MNMGGNLSNVEPTQHHEEKIHSAPLNENSNINGAHCAFGQCYTDTSMWTPNHHRDLWAFLELLQSGDIITAKKKNLH